MNLCQKLILLLTTLTLVQPPSAVADSSISSSSITQQTQLSCAQDVTCQYGSAFARSSLYASNSPVTELSKIPPKIVYKKISTGNGQCLTYAAQVTGIKTNSPRAKDVIANAPKYGFKVTKEPQVGGMIITAESSNWHAGVIIAYDSENITVRERNYKGWGIVSTRIIPRSYVKIRGVVTKN